MRNILKPQSGTQSGTPNLSQKLLIFDGFLWGRKFCGIFCAFNFDAKIPFFHKKMKK